LSRQSYPPGLYEVIVVDNGSMDDVAAVTKSFEFCRYYRETKIGSYAARNRGVRLARGNILAFTDADCIPDPGWLEHGVTELTHRTTIGIVGGKIDVCFRKAPHSSLAELVQQFTGSYRQKWHVSSEDHCALTANVFTYRHVFEDVGPFADDMLSCGDKEWGKRVFKSGYEVVYGETTIVEHPARVTMRELLVKTRRVTGGEMALLQKLEPRMATVHFAFGVIRNLKAAICVFVTVGRDARFTARQKLVIVVGVVLINITAIAERVRLLCGGIPRRR
jgi:glycosyltransferase involved in cell wall biosynthesis